ncbi:hypothetical protein [Paraburkholderia youngii]|uniref:hypothetical protein n=1 Tax=Paraburkholderia youngii TaxID=2782701 RepID=UPI003D23BFAD
MKRVDDIHQCAAAKSAIMNSTLYGKALSAYPAIFHTFAGKPVASVWGAASRSQGQRFF